VKIAIISDGDAELVSLPQVFHTIVTPHTLLRPTKLKANVYAPPLKLARALSEPLKIARARKANAIILLLDREQRHECCGELSRLLEQQVRAFIDFSSFEWFRIVLKDRMFENWLVADPEAFESLRSRFDLPHTAVQQINAGGADNIDATATLKAAANRKSYAKVADAISILRRADPNRMANSRSFRRFLHLIEAQPYKDQSKKKIS
jgi:hypothetical protein